VEIADGRLPGGSRVSLPGRTASGAGYRASIQVPERWAFNETNSLNQSAAPMNFFYALRHSIRPSQESIALAAAVNHLGARMSQNPLEREKFYRSCFQNWLTAMLDIELGLIK
jgi:hypothetical protein